MKETTLSVESTTVTSPKSEVIAGQFSGAFSRFQTAAYGDLKRMGASEAMAHKIAMDFGPDLGNAVLNSDKLAAKVGKANKEGLSKIDLKAKGETTMSNTMAIIRVIQALAEMRSEGLIDSSPAVFSSLEWTSHIRGYIAKCEKWCETVEMK